MSRALKNRGAIAPGRADVSSIELVGVWEVDEDSSYDVDTRAVNRGTYIVTHTFDGSGCFEMQSRPAISSIPGHTLIVRRLDLQRYRTLGERWRFWWVEFKANGPVHFPLYLPFPVTVTDNDIAAFSEIFASIRRERIQDRRLASALFVPMLYRWLNGLGVEPDKSSPYESRIHTAIDLMHEHLDGSLRLADMAQAAAMGERSFRTQFARVMGISPKRHYNNLRLEMAKHLLEMGTYQVAEVADRLGFSSPFHLSKAYRAHFGHPPSAEFPKY